MEDTKFSVPVIFRRGSLQNDEKRSIESGLKNIQGIKLRTGFEDWSNLNILDFGCGIKFTQAIIQDDIKIGSYFGLDVYDKMINYLKENVPNDNMFYHSVRFKNDMYLKDGEEMTPDSSLPIPSDVKFDLIVMQSVITHMNPKDTSALLHILRKYIKPQGKLFFTCFIDNEMDQDFEDKVPDRPLLNAYFKEGYLRKIIKESGWEVESYNLRSYQMQNHFVCI